MSTLQSVSVPQTQSNHIVAVGPIVTVIMPTEPVELPAQLLADARRYHAREMDQRARCRFKVQTFEDWLADLVRDRIYGKGADAGMAADWQER